MSTRTLTKRLAHLWRSERGEATVDLLTAGLATGRMALLQQQADLRQAAEANQEAQEEGWQERDDQFFAKLQEVGDAVTRATRLEAFELRGEPIPPAAPTPLAPGPTGVVEIPGNGGAISVVDRTAADPKRGFIDHRDYLFSVMDAGRGRRIDDRLKPLATQGSDEQGAYSDPYGGFLIPHGVAPGILSIAPEDDFLAPLTTDIPMRTPQVSVNARVDKNHASSVSGGLVVTRRPETVDGTSSRMKFEQVGLTAYELFGLAYASETILTDSPESFVAILSAGFNDEFAAKAIDERLNASGTGEPLGIMKAGCLITIAKESGQAAATIVAENIEKMRARCWRYGRAVWVANNDTIPQLMSLQKAIGTAGVLTEYYKAAEREGQVDTLLGRPIHFSEYAQTLGTAGDLVLGVWSEYLDGTYQPLQTAESMHVRFAANERAFRFHLRNDGQPWWRTALTPKRGSTLSPFVTLATRA